MIDKETYEKRYRPTYGSAIINMTNACNFACRYCFTDPHPVFLSAEKGIKIIDFVFEGWKQRRTKFSAPPAFSFFGGEPLLRFDETMVPMIEYLRGEKTKELQEIVPGGRFSLGVTTNGSLLNEERLRYMHRQEVGILLSIDGNRETQNHNRPFLNGKDSFDAVVKNIPLLLELFPGTTFRSTISAAMAGNLIEDFSFAVECGFKGYFCIPNAHEDWDEETLQMLKGQVLGVFLLHYGMVSKGIMPPSMSWLEQAYANYFKKDMRVSCERCGLGTTSIAFDADGRIFGCQEQATKCENLFYLGSVDEGFDESRHLKLLNQVVKYGEVKSNLFDCNQCPLKDICAVNYCPSTNYTLTGDPQIMPFMSCWWKRTLNEIAGFILQKAEKEDNVNFKSFLETIMGVK